MPCRCDLLKKKTLEEIFDIRRHLHAQYQGVVICLKRRH